MIRNWIVPLARARCGAKYAVAAACSLLSATVCAVPFQTTGHADIRFTYDAGTGTADIAYYLDEYSTVDGVEVTADNPMGGTPATASGGQTKIVFQPAELITYIPDPPVIIPNEFAELFAFTGAQGGDPLWNIPFTQEFDRPWTGISTEAVSSSDFSNIRYQLTAFNGPGQMSLLQWGPFGEPLLEIQTSNGLSSDDAIDVAAQTHAHYEWLFTEPGTYTFDLTAIGTRTPAAGGGTVSVADTFTFKVVVPEPGSAALLGLATCGLVGVRRRRSVAAAKPLAVLVALSFLLIAPSAQAAHLDIVPYFEADGAGGYEFSVGRCDFTKTADPLNGRPPAPIDRNVLVFTGFFGTHPVNGQIVNGDPGWDLPPNFADYGDSGADFPTGTQPPRNGRLKFNVVSDPRLGRNLSYWDGAGAPSFGPVPDGEILDIFKPVFAGTPESVTLNGSDESLSGFELTSNSLFPGNFHTHTGHVLWGDASRSTDPSHLPTPGFYLFSLNMEIDNGAVIPNYPNLSTTVSGIDAVSPTFHVILTYGFQNGYDEFIYGDQELQERGEYVYDDGLDDYIWVPELDGEGNPILDPVFDEFGNPVLEVIGVGGFILGPEMQQAADWVHANLAQVPEPGAAVGLVVMLVSGSWLRVRNKFSLV